MGLLERLRENREEMQINKQRRLAKQEAARIKAQAAYDVEYQKAAVKAVKGRAKRDAMERFGHSKAERRRRSLSNIGRELESWGNWAAGNQRAPSRVRSGSSKRSKGSRKSHPRQRTRESRDPFDMGDLDDLLF